MNFEMDTIEPVVVDQSAMSEIDKLESWSKSVVVSSPETRESVFAAVKSVKGLKERIVAFFRDSKEKAFAAHRAVVASEKSFTDRIDLFERAAKSAILAYDQRVEAARIAEQRRLQAIADEQARRERERAEQEAARQRETARQAQEKADAARKAAEAANAEEKARLLREAEAADRKAAAAQAKAEIKDETAAAVIAPVVEVAVPEKQKGESTRKIWKARVIDVREVPREYMVVNEKLLDSFAKATKGAVAVAGIQFYAVDSLAIR